jgi:outer membrane protein assembly factor BamE (lipoprotein component of BamABCDE complex)
MGPSQVVRAIYGNYPLGYHPGGKIKEGMSVDQVVAILGTPHERHTQGDEEHWYYYIDSFGMTLFGVDFDSQGRVVRTYSH